MPEERDAVGARLVLVTDAIRRGDIHAVGDRMRALNGAPGLDLRTSPFVLLRRMPADGGGVKEDVRAQQRGDPGRFGIPLVPADQDPDRRVARLPYLEAVRLAGTLAVVIEMSVTRREVVLLVEQRIVWDVHLPIYAEQRAVGIDHRRRVPVDAGRLALEDRHDDHDRQLAGEPLHGVGRRTGNRFSQVEPVALLRFAEIQRVEQLLQADDLCPLTGRLAYEPLRPGHIRGSVLVGVILDDSYGKRRVHLDSVGLRAKA